MKINSLWMAFLFTAVNTVSAVNGPLTLEVLFGGIKTNRVYFSPSYEGSEDTVKFSLDIRDESRIDGWAVIIYDSSWHAVWRRGGERNRDIPLDPGLFFSKLRAKKDSVEIPPELVWNGLSDSGIILPEGKYYLIAAVRDEMRNTLVSDTNEIILAITAPSGSLSLEENIFFPGSPGKKGLIFISQNLSTNGFWRAEIRDNAGNVIKTWDWESNPPMQLEWDGKNVRGDIEPEGTYDYIVYGWDKAGNKTILPLEGINLSRKAYSVFINPERSGFSPAASYPSNMMRLIPAVSITNDLVSWSLKIKDESYQSVREISGSVIPPCIVWDGRDERGKIVKDGIFSCSLECKYSDGDSIFSGKRLLEVCTKAPTAELTIEPDLFSPGGDGKNDILLIHIKVKSGQGIKKWEMTVFDPDNRPFKTFEGYKDPPPVVKWDGRSDNGELVESAGNYKAVFSAADYYGNITIVNKDIRVDILAEKTERGFHIRINNIEFEFARSRLAPKGSLILDRVAQILQKYPRYRIEIQGHTDNIGSWKKNLTLSEERARNVCDYLEIKGIPRDRMRVKGYSYKYPISDNSTEEGRRKNRRVEFILFKD